MEHLQFVSPQALRPYAIEQTDCLPRHANAHALIPPALYRLPVAIWPRALVSLGLTWLCGQQCDAIGDQPPLAGLLATA
jgi:hypothetical protein